MTLSSLLVSADEAASPVLCRVLEELGVRVESCSDVVRAAIRLAQQRFDLVILDCGSHADAVGLLRETRLSRMNDSILAVTVVQNQASIREMFSLGVNFVIYKPVAYDRALGSLRAACSVMRKEKRRRARAAVHTHAKVDYANVEQEKATLVDLAADGMAVLFGKKLPPTSKVYFTFQLPGQKSSVRLSGQVVWQDWNGMAGIQFVDVPKASRRLLDEFLSATLPDDAEKDGFSSVIVELEPSFQESPRESTALPASEPEREPQRAIPVAASPAAKASASAAQSTSATADRREKVRYACRLGAEVYRSEAPVPHHCSLTDLSPGGCYLEMHLPFPKGTLIEITVRTYHLKLRLKGVVQASHPGYGMGIAFELHNEHERDQLAKLTDFVAASAETSE